MSTPRPRVEPDARPFPPPEGGHTSAARWQGQHLGPRQVVQALRHLSPHRVCVGNDLNSGTELESPQPPTARPFFQGALHPIEGKSHRCSGVATLHVPIATVSNRSTCFYSGKRSRWPNFNSDETATPATMKPQTLNESSWMTTSESRLVPSDLRNPTV